jgi:23S rRNA pseudouridine955/2504/2580 synthase
LKKQNNEKIFIATSNDEGRILLKFLIKILDNVPISRIYKLLRKKDVKVNGKRVSNSKIVIKEHDKI